MRKKVPVRVNLPPPEPTYGPKPLPFGLRADGGAGGTSGGGWHIARKATTRSSSFRHQVPRPVPIRSGQPRLSAGPPSTTKGTEP